MCCNHVASFYLPCIFELPRVENTKGCDAIVLRYLMVVAVFPLFSKNKNSAFHPELLQQGLIRMEEKSGMPKGRKEIAAWATKTTHLLGQWYFQQLSTAPKLHCFYYTTGFLGRGICWCHRTQFYYLLTPGSSGIKH